MSFATAILALSVVFVTSCASTYERRGQSLQEMPVLKARYSFAFRYQGDRYFFAPDHYKQDGRECYLYFGFKNERLVYAFSLSVFQGIEKDYREQNSPDKIKSAILERIKNEPAAGKRCFELGQGPPPDAGQGEAIALMFWPIAIPFAVYGLYDYQSEKNRILKISNHLRLGMPRSELPAAVLSRTQVKRRGPHEYLEYKDERLTGILYFEEGLLDAWSLYSARNQ